MLAPTPDCKEKAKVGFLAFDRVLANSHRERSRHVGERYSLRRAMAAHEVPKGSRDSMAQR